MTRLILQDGDKVREMTDAEHAQYLLDQTEATARQEAADTATAAIAAAKKSAYKKLAALGLTADEIAAL